MYRRSTRTFIAIGALVACTAPAYAQWAVVDAHAIVQLVQQVKTLEVQLETARSHLLLANRTMQGMVGSRGMELLENGTPRNYLPASWAELSSALQGGGTYPALRAAVNGAMAANAILTPAQLAALSAADRQHVVAARQAGALQSALAQQALANSSARFASVQRLIAAIPKAIDQKGILDLQARIGAELGMLQNEHTKLDVLRQATDAQDAVRRQQEHEDAIAAYGRFESRFRPTPSF